MGIIPAAALTMAMSAGGDRPTEGFRREHVEVKVHLDHVQQRVDALTAGHEPDPRRAMDHVVRALEVHLVPHAQWEDRVLYPQVDEKAGTGVDDRGADNRFTATMRREHAIVERWLGELRALAAAPKAESAAFARKANQLLGLVQAHFEVEEQVLLPVLDRTMTRDEVDRMMQSAHTRRRNASHGR